MLISIEQAEELAEIISDDVKKDLKRLKSKKEIKLEDTKDAKADSEDDI